MILLLVVNGVEVDGGEGQVSGGCGAVHFRLEFFDF